MKYLNNQILLFFYIFHINHLFKIINLNILNKIAVQPNIIPQKKTRKRLSPNTKKKREEMAQTKRNVTSIIKKMREDEQIEKVLDKLDKDKVIKVDI